MAQLACLRDVVVPAGERIIIRSMSPVTTIGGGRILDNNARKNTVVQIKRAMARLSKTGERQHLQWKS